MISKLGIQSLDRSSPSQDTDMGCVCCRITELHCSTAVVWLCTVVPLDAALSPGALLDGGHFNPEKPDCGPVPSEHSSLGGLVMS